MSAIKKFLDTERAAIRIRNERIAEMEREMYEEESVYTPEDDMQLQDEIKNFEFLLNRNWFLDNDEIVDLLWDASEYAFQHILSNVSSYPARVRDVIYDNFIPRKIANQSVRELSDHDMLKIYMKQDDDMNQEIETAWQTYLKTNGVTRPDGELEDVLDYTYEQLTKQKKMLDQERSKKSKNYVPPSMRGSKVTSPVADKLEASVQSLENEIDTLNKQIEQEEKSWYATRRAEFALSYVSMPIVS